MHEAKADVKPKSKSYLAMVLLLVLAFGLVVEVCDILQDLLDGFISPDRLTNVEERAKTSSTHCSYRNTHTPALLQLPFFTVSMLSGRVGTFTFAIINCEFCTQTMPQF